MDSRALVDRYFELAPQSDTAQYFAQFTADATVEDEGNTYRGVDAIKDWRRVVPAVIYTVCDVTTIGEVSVAHAEVSGDFPGSPVELSFRFTFTTDGCIQALSITA